MTTVVLLVERLLRDAGMRPSSEYIPRQPGESLLARVVSEGLETFLAWQQERERPVPAFASASFGPFWIAAFWSGDFCAARAPALQFLWPEPVAAVLV